MQTRLWTQKGQSTHCLRGWVAECSLWVMLHVFCDLLFVELLTWSCLCIRKYVLDLAIAKLCTVQSKLYLFCINHVLGFRPRPLIYHSMSGLRSIQHVWSSCFTYNDSLGMCAKISHEGHGYVITHNKMCNYLSMPQLNNFGTHIPVFGSPPDPGPFLSGVPDYFDRNKILSGYDLSH